MPVLALALAVEITRISIGFSIYQQSHHNGFEAFYLASSNSSPRSPVRK